MQKAVIRFTAKYHAALLLNKRLFHPEQDAHEYVETVKLTPYGANHPVQWGRVSSMPNIELQAFVRRAWMSVNTLHKTSNMEMFIYGIVTPSLKVNPTCVDSKMTALFACYAEALCSHRLNVPWQSSAFMVWTGSSCDML